ncbi:helix-turn-helix transcriptional regulator [Nocardioides sp.]|uniref:helix-turn-helix domain-containing protein n=1 Tax=Nocardioides sp. TaxID=35761 RepID=UPI00262C1785|nr:helix-turn-helix transcriptional regulator [Nocardioides sp.]MDI6911450.1 helix-turn-helix transcriptional regulator [Nocardioides sp.]
MPQVTDQEAIAANVRAAKARRRVTDADIANAIGASRSAINDRMNGRAKFQIDELQRIAAFLDVPLEQLLAPAEAAVS